MASPRCFAMNARLPADGDAPRSTFTNAISIPPPLTECLKISADGLPALQSHFLRAKTAIWELSNGVQRRPTAPLSSLISASLSARALAKRPLITAAGSVSEVSRSLQAIRNPVSNALKGYLAP